MSKLLLIEDDALIIRVYQKIFSMEGFEVETAEDGLEGWEKANSWKPTLILLDIVMPKMNGIELLERLKANSETKNIPVIILTNLAGQGDSEKALKLGAVKYLIKSQYDAKQVADEVKEILKGYTRDEVPAKKD